MSPGDYGTGPLPSSGGGDWTATFDQVLAEVGDTARLVRRYYDSLIGQGFSRGEALMLTVSFQDKLLEDPEDDA